MFSSVLFAPTAAAAPTAASAAADTAPTAASVAADTATAAAAAAAFASEVPREVFGQALRPDILHQVCVCLFICLFCLFICFIIL